MREKLFKGQKKSINTTRKRRFRIVWGTEEKGLSRTEEPRVEPHEVAGGLGRAFAKSSEGVRRVEL